MSIDDRFVGSRLRICTWFVGDKTGDETIFPQMGSSSSTIAFQRVYWQCIWMFFKTARHFNPLSELCLFVDRPDHPLCHEFTNSLRLFGVKIQQVPFASRPPKGFSESFGNQLYICDIVRFIASVGETAEVWLVLDSDCVHLASISDLILDTQRHGVLTLDLSSKVGEVINGLTENDLGDLAFELGIVSDRRPVTYFGGEFFAATGSKCCALSPRLDALLAVNISRWREGRKSIKEEAHLLSLVYAEFGISSGTANRYIRRIWTTFKYNTAARSDLNLPIWHVPAEKRFGIDRMYKLANRRPLFFDYKLGSAEFPGFAGSLLGVPRRTLAKAFRDILLKLYRRVLR